VAKARDIIETTHPTELAVHVRHSMGGEVNRLLVGEWGFCFRTNVDDPRHLLCRRGADTRIRSQTTFL